MNLSLKFNIYDADSMSTKQLFKIIEKTEKKLYRKFGTMDIWTDIDKMETEDDL